MLKKLKNWNFLSWLAVAGAAWTIGFVHNVVYGGDLSFLRIMYQRKMAIAAQVDAPRRLLITGGSGAHYTINSELLEKELGMPVLNLGIDGPVGLNVILPGIIEQVRPGDIVLLIPEYLIILDDDGFGDRSAPFVLATGQPGLGGVPSKDLAQNTLLLGVLTLRSTVESTIDLIKEGKPTAYYNDPLTERGDPTIFFDRKGEWWKMTFKKPISKHAVKRITQFREEVEAKGGSLVLSLPWVYAKREDEKTMDNVQKTAAKLKEIAPLIYDKNSLNVQTDSNLFADTHYHLKPEATIIRSKQIVRELKPILSKLPPPPQEAN
ncbi:MAG: hypothetical protein WBA93_22450 [Microcoleaceae cyanobacterium]